MSSKSQKKGNGSKLSKKVKMQRENDIKIPCGKIGKKFLENLMALVAHFVRLMVRLGLGPASVV